MNQSNRIIFNTSVVYLQLIVNTIVGVITIKYVLQALGSEDYGIYMLVGGIIAMLNVLTTTMSNTAMRFLSHNLGKNNPELSKKTFGNTLRIHYILGLVLVLLLELLGFVMFEFVFNIPLEKVFDSKVVYQCMVCTSLVSIISVPYDAVINSHENMLFLSIVNIVDYIFRLILAISLLFYGGDRLIFYAIFTMVICIVIRLIKQTFSKLKYRECDASAFKDVDKSMMKEMMKFTQWKLFGDFAVVMQTQMRAVLMNHAFGTIYNAGEGLANRVKAQVNMVSVGITRAITPQMNSSEGAGNRSRMLNLTIVGVKFTTFMFGLISMPLIFETSYILCAWLGSVPLMAVTFCRLCFIIQMIDKLTWQIGNAIMAVGDIKKYQIMSGMLPLLGIMFSYIALTLGSDVLSVYFITIIMEIFIGSMRLYYGKTIAQINPWYFIKSTTIPVLCPMFIASLPCLIIHYQFEASNLRLILVCLIFIVLNVLLFYCFSMTKDEKMKINTIIRIKL